MNRQQQKHDSDSSHTTTATEVAVNRLRSCLCPALSPTSSLSPPSSAAPRSYLKHAVEASIGFIADLSSSSQSPIGGDECPLSSPLVDYLIDCTNTTTTTSASSSSLLYKYPNSKKSASSSSPAPTIGHLTKKATSMLADRVLLSGGGEEGTAHDEDVAATIDLPPPAPQTKTAASQHHSESKVLGSCIGVFAKHLVEQAISGNMTTWTPSTISHRKLLLLPTTTATTVNKTTTYFNTTNDVSAISTSSGGGEGFPQLSVLSTTMALSTAGHQRAHMPSSSTRALSSYDDEQSSVLDTDPVSYGDDQDALFEFWFTHDECILLSPIVQRAC